MSGLDQTGMFPPLDAIDPVTREGHALVQRYRLMRALTGNDGIRRDLRDGPPDPILQAEMIRQLVPGVDAPLDNSAIDWPIPAGVRLEALYASPWLRDVAKERKLFTLPETAEAFAERFRARTGIAPQSHAMQRNFRITPLELGHIAMEVRGDGKDPSLAFLLLCSRHFEAAASIEGAEFFGLRREDIDFRRPLIDGFMLLAEIERAALILQDLSRLNLINVNRIRALLRGDGRLLGRYLRKHPELRRLLAYQMIGSEATGVLERVSLVDPDTRDVDALAVDGEVAARLGIGANVRAVAAARGQADVDIVEALTGSNGAQARTLLLAAFPDNPPGTRVSPLRSQSPVAFYGLDTKLLGAMLADLGREFQHGDVHAADHADHERQVMLFRVVAAHAAPILLARELAVAATNAGKPYTGINYQRDATAYGALMLPGRAYPGSAPRARAELWRDRYQDEPIWRAMLERDLGDIAKDLNEDQRREIALSWARTSRIFARAFDNGSAGADAQAQQDAVHAACDMATAVSAVSANRAFARAMLDWLQVYADGKKQSPPRAYGLRWLSAIPHILRIRSHKGLPSTADGARGSPYGRKQKTIRARALKKK